MGLTEEEKSFVYKSMDWYVACIDKFSSDDAFEKAISTALGILSKLGIQDHKNLDTGCEPN